MNESIDELAEAYGAKPEAKEPGQVARDPVVASLVAPLINTLAQELSGPSSVASPPAQPGPSSLSPELDHRAWVDRRSLKIQEQEERRHRELLEALGKILEAVSK